MKRKISIKRLTNIFKSKIKSKEEIKLEPDWIRYEVLYTSNYLDSFNEFMKIIDKDYNYSNYDIQEILDRNTDEEVGNNTEDTILTNIIKSSNDNALNVFSNVVILFEGEGFTYDKFIKELSNILDNPYSIIKNDKSCYVTITIKEIEKARTTPIISEVFQNISYTTGVVSKLIPNNILSALSLSTERIKIVNDNIDGITIFGYDNIELPEYRTKKLYLYTNNKECLDVLISKNKNIEYLPMLRYKDDTYLFSMTLYQSEFFIFNYKIFNDILPKILKRYNLLIDK